MAAMDKRLAIIQEGQGWVALDIEGCEAWNGDYQLKGLKIAEAPSLIELLKKVPDYVGEPSALPEDDLARKMPKPSRVSYTYRATPETWDSIKKAWGTGAEKLIDGRRVFVESVRPYDNQDGSKNLVYTVRPMAENAMPGPDEMEGI